MISILSHTDNLVLHASGFPTSALKTPLVYLSHLFLSVKNTWDGAPTLIKISCILLFFFGILPGLVLFCAYHNYKNFYSSSCQDPLQDTNTAFTPLTTGSPAQEQPATNPFLMRDDGQSPLPKTEPGETSLTLEIQQRKKDLEEEQSDLLVNLKMLEEAQDKSLRKLHDMVKFSCTDAELLDKVKIAAKKMLPGQEKQIEKESSIIFQKFLQEKTSILQRARLNRADCNEAFCEAVCVRVNFNYLEEVSIGLKTLLLKTQSYQEYLSFTDPTLNFQEILEKMSIFFNGEELKLPPSETFPFEEVRTTSPLPETSRMSRSQKDFLDNLYKCIKTVLEQNETFVNEGSTLIKEHCLAIQRYMCSLVDPSKTLSEDQNTFLSENNLELRPSSDRTKNSIHFKSCEATIQSCRILSLVSKDTGTPTQVYEWKDTITLSPWDISHLYIKKEAKEAVGSVLPYSILPLT